jgi:hypothetical protein
MGGRDLVHILQQQQLEQEANSSTVRPTCCCYCSHALTLYVSLTIVSTAAVHSLSCCAVCVCELHAG